MSVERPEGAGGWAAGIVAAVVLGLIALGSNPEWWPALAFFAVIFIPVCLTQMRSRDEREHWWD